MQSDEKRVVTVLDLDAIEQRAEAATDGPWGVVLGDTVVAEPINVTRGSASYKRRICSFDEYDYEEAEDEYDEPADLTADAEFIAAARTDVPALVAEVRRLQDGIDQALEEALVRVRAARDLDQRVRRNEDHDYSDSCEDQDNWQCHAAGALTGFADALMVLAELRREFS